LNAQADPKRDMKAEAGLKIDTNAKIVQWSDGTYALSIGDEFFDLSIENLTRRQVFTMHDNYALYKGAVEKRMIVKPPQTSQR
jgi:hypothetical protein